LETTAVAIVTGLVAGVAAECGSSVRAPVEIGLGVLVLFLGAVGFAALVHVTLRNWSRPSPRTVAGGLVLGVLALAWGFVFDVVPPVPLLGLATLPALLCIDGSLRGHLRLRAARPNAARRLLATITVATVAGVAFVALSVVAPADSIHPWPRALGAPHATADPVVAELDSSDALLALGVAPTRVPMRTWERSPTPVRWLETPHGALAWFPAHDEAYTLLSFHQPDGPDGPFALSHETLVDAVDVFAVTATRVGPVVAVLRRSAHRDVEQVLVALDRDLALRAQVPVRDGLVASLVPVEGSGSSGVFDDDDERIRVIFDDGAVLVVSGALSRWPDGALSSTWTRFGPAGLALSLLGLLPFAFFARRAARAVARYYRARASTRVTREATVGDPSGSGLARVVGCLGDATLRLEDGSTVALDATGAEVLGHDPEPGSPCVAVGRLEANRRAAGAYRGPATMLRATLLAAGDDSALFGQLGSRARRAWMNALTATWATAFALVALSLL
jgi:hypothetical protein